MGPQDVCKKEPSETGEQKPLFNAPTSSEWRLSSTPTASYGSSATAHTVSSVFTSLPLAGHAPANGHTPTNGHALPPRSNHELLYPVHPSFQPQQPTGPRSNDYFGQPPNFPSVFYPPAHPEPAPGPSQLPLLPEFPISDDESSSLPPVEEILKNVAQPALKVAGARRRPAKSKGKAKALDEYPTATRGTKRKTPSEPGDEVEVKRARTSNRGRQSGSANYFKEDLDILMQVAREVLPMGARGWEEVGRRFNEMAQTIGRPTRPYKSLELKLKNLAKTAKPTGTATVPEHVTQALEIEDLINAKAGTVELDDDDIIDVNSDNDDDGDGMPKNKKVQYMARHSKGSKPLSTQIRNGNHTFLTNIGLALDPSSRQARQESFQLQFMQNQQIAILTQQLRDAQKRVDSLSAQLVETERRYQEAERRADRAERRSLISTSTHSHTSTQPVPPPIQNPVIPPEPAPLRESYRQDNIYLDGQATIFGNDSDHDDEYGTGESPGTRRFAFLDSRNYEESSASGSSSGHASSSRHNFNPASSRVNSYSPNDDDDDAETECSQPL